MSTPAKGAKAPSIIYQPMSATEPDTKSIEENLITRAPHLKFLINTTFHFLLKINSKHIKTNITNDINQLEIKMIANFQKHFSCCQLAERGLTCFLLLTIKMYTFCYYPLSKKRNEINA